MNFSHIEHIGIAVKNLDYSVKQYEKLLGIKCYAIEKVEDQNVRTAFFKVGNTKIELLEPTSKNSPIYKFIEKRGEGLHHIAFHADDVNNALMKISGLGFNLIDKSAKEGAEGLRIGFLHPKSTNGVLIEICGEK